MSTHLFRRSARILVLLLVVASIVTACGGAPAATEPPPPTSTTLTEAPAATPSPAAEAPAATPPPTAETHADTKAPATPAEGFETYMHPSGAFHLDVPNGTEADETDEGVDLFLSDTALLMVYNQESTDTLKPENVDTIAEEVLDDYLVGSGIATDYTTEAAEKLDKKAYHASFTYSSEDYGDGAGVLFLKQQGETLYLMILVSPELASFEDAWIMALDTFGTAEADQVAADEGTPADEATPADAAEPTATEPIGSADPSSPSADGQTWLILFYSDADDQVLEQDMFIDLNEVERVGSTDRVQMVAQVDRFKGAFGGDGDWTSTKRYYVTQNSDLNTITSEELEDLGEVNMADGDTLVDFVTWGVENYPADKYVLILSDHGMGWPGGWSDPDPAGPGKHGTLLDSQEDMLLLMEIDEALASIQAQTGIDKFELIGFDACLMSHLEVFDMLVPYARYAVASQETEPAMGWSYASFLSKLVENPDMDGAELGKNIVDSYIVEDTRIVDDEARRTYFSDMGLQAPDARRAAELFGEDITLTAVNLEALPELNTALDTFSSAIATVDQATVASARTYAQSFENVFDPELPSPYIDLGHFALLVANESGNAEAQAAQEQVATALSHVIVAEKHGPNRPGATGISIYFPNSDIYEVFYETYAAVCNRFVTDTQWDEFLAYHYTGEEIEGGIPQRGTQFIAPGASELNVAPLTASEEAIPADGVTTISTEVTGDEIGYIYTYLGYYDEESNSMFVADMDFLSADTIKDVGGVVYPDWGDERPIPIDYDWEPALFEISDGVTTTYALIEPDTYGKTDEDTTYFVSGIYTFVDTRDQRYAELIFDATGQLVKVVGYANIDGSGAPRQVTPQPGDTFTVLEHWIQLNDQDEEVEFSEEEGGTLTFGDTPFTWNAVDAAPGEYEVGIIAEDMDGNYYEEYISVTVTE